MDRIVKIALDDVRSHHNVGSVFRSADAFGVEEVILGGITPRPPHRDIQKTALGATESVPYIHEEHLIDELRAQGEKGFKIIGIEQDARSTLMPPYLEHIVDKVILVMGNEVNGISTPILELCDEIWEIPQKGIKKSLNISVCAGIVMYLTTKP
jgi:23S rRNA (guanosine2251-2'-O)-methyltransferase